MDLSAEWPYIEQVAFERLANNITERHVSKYGTDIEVMGAAGELAARRFFQISEELHTRFDSGADIIYKGVKIDVKATLWTPRLMRRHMQWPIWKELRADVVLLTGIDLRAQAAVVVGYALPHEILKAPVNYERSGACHEIPIPKLRKPSRLLFLEGKDDLTHRPQAYTDHRLQRHR